MKVDERTLGVDGIFINWENYADYGNAKVAVLRQLMKARYIQRYVAILTQGWKEGTGNGTGSKRGVRSICILQNSSEDTK